MTTSSNRNGGAAPDPSISRRRFVEGAGAAAAAAMTLRSASSAYADGDRPAVLGGRPIRSGGWPSWPVTDEGEERALSDVLHSGNWFRYAGGNSVQQFEQQWSEEVGSRYCQSTNGGTSALITALAALEIGPGDEVLVPPYTFIASVNCILLHHALPVFVDSDPSTAQIDVAQIEPRINGDTRCLLPVHLGGASCDMDALVQVAGKHRLPIVEDSCQSHTGEWKGKRLGSFGDAGCYSFQNSKNLTSGEGGALVTEREDLYHRAQAYHSNGNGHFDHGGHFTANGANLRLTEFQGALLTQQLRRLEQQSRRREQNAAYLDSLLADVDGVTPKKKLSGTTRHGYHLYVFDYDPAAFAGMTKDQFRAALGAEGIPVSGGYRATNKMPWVEQMLQARGFQRIYGQSRLNRWREENHLPANDRMLDTTCWLSQYLLLAEKEDMELIAAAMRRVQKHAATIAKQAE